MANVFISYAKEDVGTARLLSDALSRAGFTVWWDRHIPPGKTWDDVIGRALDTAACVLVLWSKISTASRWVREEAERAAGRNCLIPVLIEQVQPPFGFGRIEAADLSDWHGEETDAEFIMLRAAVADLVQAAETAPISATAAGPAVAPARAPISAPVSEPATPPVAAAAALPKKTGINPMLYAAAAVVLVAVGGWLYMGQNHSPETPSPVTVVLPSVIGLSADDARQLLKSKGFSRIVQGHRASSEVEPGTVLRQDPPAGTNLPTDSSVRLIIAARGRVPAAEDAGSGAQPPPTRTEPASPGNEPAASPAAGDSSAPSLSRKAGGYLSDLAASKVSRYLSTAPQQVSPANGIVFNHYPRSTTLVWKPVAGAQTYSVETTFLSPGQHCSSAQSGHVVNGIAEATYTFNFVGAQPGCWRVWSADEKGSAGPKSPWWEFVYTR